MPPPSARGIEFFYCWGGEGGAEAFRAGGRGGGGDKKGEGAGGSSLQNLHAMVAGVGHDNAPVAVDSNAATRAVELSVA